MKNFFYKHFKEYYLAPFCWWIPSSCENHCNLMCSLGLYPWIVNCLKKRLQKSWLKVHKYEIILNFCWPKSNPYMPFVNFRKKFRFFSLNFCQNFDVRTFPRWLSIRGTKFFWWAIQKFFLQNLHFGPIRWVPRRLLKISIIYSQNCILIWYFWVFSKIIVCVCWAYAETILSHADHTQNRFHRTLSNAYEEQISAHAQPAVKCEQLLHVQSMLSIRGTKFIAHWAYAERISSHAEHRRNRFHRMLSKCFKVEYLGRIEYNFQKSPFTGPWDHMVSVSAKKV